MLNVVREVDEAGLRSRELGEPASSWAPTAVDLGLLATLAAEPFDAETVMERLVSSADHD
jgi:hypothetical protein